MSAAMRTWVALTRTLESVTRELLTPAGETRPKEKYNATRERSTAASTEETILHLQQQNAKLQQQLSMAQFINQREDKLRRRMLSVFWASLARRMATRGFTKQLRKLRAQRWRNRVSIDGRRSLPPSKQYVRQHLHLLSHFPDTASG